MHNFYKMKNILKYLAATIVVINVIAFTYNQNNDTSISISLKDVYANSSSENEKDVKKYIEETYTQDCESGTYEVVECILDKEFGDSTDCLETGGCSEQENNNNSIFGDDGNGNGGSNNGNGGYSNSGEGDYDVYSTPKPPYSAPRGFGWLYEKDGSWTLIHITQM